MARDAPLVAFLDDCKKASKRPVYVGFGSMEPWAQSNALQTQEQSNGRENSHANGSDSTRSGDRHESDSLTEAPRKRHRVEAQTLHAETDPTELSHRDLDTHHTVLAAEDSLRSSLLLDTLIQVLELLQVPGILHNIPPVKTSESTRHTERSNVLLVGGYIDLAWLFPQCSAVVHHGGAGTTTEAALAGIPQVVCPVAFDQRFWADRVEWLGLGFKCDIFNSTWSAAPTASSSSAASLLTEQLRSALRCQSAASLQSDLTQEQGLQACLSILDDLLEAPTYHHSRRYRTA